MTGITFALAAGLVLAASASALKGHSHPKRQMDGLGVGQLFTGDNPLASLVGGLGLAQPGDAYPIDGYLVADVLGPLGCKNDYAIGIIGNLTVPGLLNLCYCIEVADTAAMGKNACPKCVEHSQPICQKGSCDCECETGYYSTPFVAGAEGADTSGLNRPSCTILPVCGPGQNVSKTPDAAGLLSCICLNGAVPGLTDSYGGCLLIPGPPANETSMSSAPVFIAASSSASMAPTESSESMAAPTQAPSASESSASVPYTETAEALSSSMAPAPCAPLSTAEAMSISSSAGPSGGGIGGGGSAGFGSATPKGRSSASARPTSSGTSTAAAMDSSFSESSGAPTYSQSAASPEQTLMASSTTNAAFSLLSIVSFFALFV